jgi:hypothetical protein
MLTYNLYMTHGSDLLASRSVTLEPERLPLYKLLRNFVDQPAVKKELENGMVLEALCAHSMPTRRAVFAQGRRLGYLRGPPRSWLACLGVPDCPL